jgi:large subunit ribosomal protein L29
MKISVLRELKELPEAELSKKLTETQYDLYSMRVQCKTGQMEKTAEIREKRKTIARILTEVNDRSKKQAKKDSEGK